MPPPPRRLGFGETRFQLQDPCALLVRERFELSAVGSEAVSLALYHPQLGELAGLALQAIEQLAERVASEAASLGLLPPCRLTAGADQPRPLKLRGRNARHPVPEAGAQLLPVDAVADRLLTQAGGLCRLVDRVSPHRVCIFESFAGQSCKAS